ncbi:Integrator complex subunit 1 [Halotydeus destructor]|nr:Integrator complex subunit 1 [Halotydeus destructor]
MTVTNHFEFPPPTMQGEDLRGKLRQILALEKQQILQFEVQLAAASTKTQINEQNSLLLSKLIQYDPEGPAREPPPVVLDQLRSVASSLKLGSLLCQSRSPDFLYEIIQRQQKQRTAHQLTAYPNSMPWLGDLVEANEENYSILSVRSLCVYLLGQIYDEDCNLQSLEYIGKGGDRVKRKEKRRKQLRLIAHLQGILNTNEQLSRDLIEFFMERLSIQNSSLRQLSSKALNLIFRDPDSIDDFSLCPENNLSNWLLNKLPLTKYFEFLKLIVCEGLRLAILVETQPKDICIYVQFLEKYASPLDTGIALSLSNLLIDRTIITKHLVQGPLREGFLSSATKLFHAYLHTVKKRDNRGYWSEAQDKVMIQWQAGETAILNIMIVHAMIILLTHGPTESSRKLYDSLMSTWFSDPPPQSFLVDTSEEALLIPDWLKMKLIRSSSAQLADAGLMDLEPHQLILFIQSFGIPEPSMEKLLSALDECCDTNEATLMASITDRKFMKHLVEVQWMRGVTAGHKFAHMLDMPDE